MAGHLSVATVVEKNKISSDVAFVILLEVAVTDPNTRQVVETLYLARNNENVLFDPEGKGEPKVYQAANFEINVDEKQGQAPSVTITAQDQTGFIQARQDAYAGGVFSECTMTVVNSARLDKPAEIREKFLVLSSNAKDYVVTFTLGAENMITVAFPKHMQSRDRCAWRFKGYGCGYVGAITTCDYTKDGPNGCKQHFPGQPLPIRALPGLVLMNI